MNGCLSERVSLFLGDLLLLASVSHLFCFGKLSPRNIYQFGLSRPKLDWSKVIREAGMT